MSDLFSSLNIKGKRLKNRIVVAPTERVGLTYTDSIMGADVIHEYEMLAENNAGLIMTQSLVVAPEDAAAVGFPLPGIWKETQITPLKRIVEAAHQNGALLIAQLGVARPYSPRWTTAEVERLREDLIAGALRCAAAGADGVEIHGAHDVTLNHILSPRTNRRTDRYSDGLTLVNEAVEAIRAEVGEDLILSFRMGCCFDWEKDIATAKRIEAMGFDLLNVSVGVQEGYAPGIPSDYDYTPMTYAASLLKQHVGIPVIAAWGIDTLRRGEQLIQKGEADLVAYGKSFLADPGFVTRSMGNPDYSPCVHCRACRWYSDGAKCPGRMRANRYAESGKSS